METTRRLDLKRVLFFGFLLASLVLIVLIWNDHLADEPAGSRGYYRATQPADAAIDATRPAAAHSLVSGTPAPLGQIERQDGGPHPATRRLTPTPTIDWDAIEEDQ